MSVEIFTDPSGRSSAAGRSEEEYAFAPYLTKNNVRISPGHMLFDNAYDGKHYQQKLVIQNCGNRLVLVRLLHPTSSSFQFKSFADGICLSPGMRITRTVKYTYSTAFAVPKGFTSIWVNDDEVRYYFIVVLASAVLSVEPQQLDFGRINAVNYAMTRTFYIRNSGFKGSHFAIDLGRNALDMIVEPLKGMVPARSRVAITVEIVGIEEGEFTEEFWVKTSPPQRVVVSGTFICPKLLVRSFINSLDFTLIDFQPTYHGSRSTEPLLIKNFSSSPSMYCVMAEIKGTTMTLADARELDDNYKHFIVKPIDGRIAALRGAIIQVTFAPVQNDAKKEKNYAACFLKVVRMDCRDVTSDDDFYGRGSQDDLTSDNVSLNETLSSLTRDNVNISDNALSTLRSLIEEEESSMVEETLSFEHAIGVCLHGEKEPAGVHLRPTSFVLKELAVGKVYQRELLVTNKSKRLPVRVRYQKVISIEVIPSEFDLEAGGSTEVLVTIRTLKVDRAARTVVLELLGIDRPDDKKTIYRKVGTSSFRVCFEATSFVRKIPCPCAVSNKLPLQFETEAPYGLSGIELAKKYQNDQYYLSYIRSLRKLPQEENEETKEYDLTYPKPLKYGGKCQSIPIPKKRQGRYSPFWPLSPMLLYNIKIRPKSLKLKKVAAYTTLVDFFEIQNLNIFPIFVFLQASKPYLVFNNYGHVIESMENKKIYFSFCTSNIGRYYINISILVNGSTVYIVTAIAQAVPKTLRVDTSTIQFRESDGNYKFFKVINALNAHTSFDWDVNSTNFEIYPSEGGIKAESVIMCMIAYRHEPAESNTCECVLTSESGQKRTISVVYEERAPSVVFDTYEIDFQLIPLNVPIRRRLTLKNLKNFPVSYSIPGGIPIPGINVEPREGILDGLDSQVFIIDVLLRAVVKFTTTMYFFIDEEEEVTIDLRGVVEYPQTSLHPHSLYFRKIAPFSYDTLAFQISNLSDCESQISFPLEEFSEFTINEHPEDLYSHDEDMVLLPQQSKTLFLHFYPQYVSTYVFYLPYTVNGILGPANIKSGQSITSSFFLQPSLQSYKTNTNLTFKNIPKGLPVLRINSTAIEKTLEFSSLKINFLYYGPDSCYNVTTTDFEITNVSTETVKVCIRTDDLNDPFSLTPKSEENIELYEVSYKITLEPSARISLEANFFPVNLGTYVTKLPIFLRGYYDNRIFNHLTLLGVYDTPSIVPKSEHCNFEPVPLRVRNEYQLTLIMKKHYQECEVEMHSECQELNYKIVKIKKEKGKTQMEIILWYDCTEVLCLDTVATFRCSCQSVCTVKVTGVAETCLVTSHAYCQMLRETDVSKYVRKIQSPHNMTLSKTNRVLFNDNKTCYPLFPREDDTSWYGVYMRRVQKMLENWLFTQAFYRKNYYRIPEGFSDCCKVGESAKKKRFGGYIKPILRDLPLLELITNIAGSDTRDQLGPSCPQELTEMVWFRYTCYANSNVLNYFRSFSLYSPHVESKLLLNYDQYVMYEKLKRPGKKPMGETTFYRLSKQCWIDLILQIFKTFYLVRTVQAPEQGTLGAVESQIRFKNSQSVSSRLSEEEWEIMLDPAICGRHVEELKKWLRTIYEDERHRVWSSSPAAKEFGSLDLELRDGLILGALTVYYCPYMKNEIKDMYPKPVTPEEIFHNICVLVNVWLKLKLSYEFSPLSMEKSTMLEMLFLCNYLYAVLPNYLPRETITIDAPLTQIASETIDLENLGKDAIRYRTIFIGNENDFFKVSYNVIVVGAKHKRAVKIRYHAKSVKTKATTLIFSGETPGYKYGKTLAVTLTGQVDVSYACMTIPVKTDLYRFCEITMNLQSPFKVKADYSVLFGPELPGQQKRDIPSLYPFEVLRHLKTVREFVFREDMWKFDSEGRCTVTQFFCCMLTGVRTVWLCFTNPEVGDWSIRLVGQGKANPDCYENVFVALPKNYGSLLCRCKPKPSVTTNCPLIIRAKLPMKNNLLWQARKKMILKNVDEQELNFWNKRLFTPTGTRIMKLVINSETHPLKLPIEDNVEYKVEPQQPSPFVTLRHVVVEDVISDDYFDLPIHPVTDLRQVEKVLVKLISPDGLETRFYRLIFEHDAGSNQSVTENLQ